MNDYNKAQVDYRDGCKARIKRQMEISKKFIRHHYFFFFHFDSFMHFIVIFF